VGEGDERPAPPSSPWAALGGARGKAAAGRRTITVFAAIVPLVLVVVFVLAELLVGHD